MSELNTDPVRHPPVLQRTSRFSRLLMAVIALVVGAAAAGYLFLNYDRFINYDRFVEGGPTIKPVAITDTSPAEDPGARKALISAQREMAAALESTRQELAAQQASLNKLSEKVSNLATKVDELQSAPRIAAPDPVRPVAVAPRKKPAPSRPPASISVGGAPLPASPQDGR